jgi:uncharacterized protein DUF3943
VAAAAAARPEAAAAGADDNAMTAGAAGLILFLVLRSSNQEAPAPTFQAAVRPATIVSFAPQTGAPDGRACPGCPPRRLGKAFLQVTYVNVVYELANLIRGQVTAHITPKTWWTNMKRGWEWDLDDFVVNQIGHPYQGNNYFTTGRANGLSFWESSALTAFGSGTWEYFGETNQASLNDFINTTLGGIALGEMFHRTAWLIRDTHATGRSRTMKEIGATALDPMTGLNRYLTGDATRVVDKPADMVPSSLGAITSAGVLWRGSTTSFVESGTFPFVEVNVRYGDPSSGRSRTPYDAFGVRLDFGGGRGLSEANVRGRLLGQPFRNGAFQLNVSQAYQFNANDAYQFGAQSFETNFSVLKNFTPSISMWAAGWGGVTVLGAVDSLPPGVSPDDIPDEEPDDGAGQGVSTGPRFYDYGPGTNVGGFLSLRHRSQPFLALSYEAHHLYVVDGIRANHLLQRARLDLHIPVRGKIGVGVSGEIFDRRTFYQTPGTDRAKFQFPQFRAYLTWSAS